ncbi:MAG: ABC transporter ATP-binding protein [Lewinellaceae bacterium]|nr:ABC transporter ATP-binding protein [Saprospiraceae bacterium]MCB9339210.1 ABC transporter ATP-binding protein [Lewinellaceae bacterium]
MSHSIFEIRNLRCEYVPGVPVLQLRKLDIPAGKLIFIIGKSGIGKSTLIETLGLMNRTIARHPDTSIKFQPANGGEYELKDSWDLPNERLSEFRKNHFSFVFQNTNLMPNFTSGENMAISLLIKGKPFQEAKKEVLSVMDRLSLGRDIFDKKITEISGGQRQRLAFVRAVTADFSVLFGDEPTGNLDKNTAEELMGLLKELIRDKGKTGIVVSHDLNQAEKFADMIVPITVEWNEEGMPAGDIVPENIIHKNGQGWAKPTGEPMKNPIQFLNQFLASVHAEPTAT